MSVCLKDVNAGRDDMAREICDKDKILVGQMVVDHECLKVGARYDGGFTTSHYSLVMGAFEGLPSRYTQTPQIPQLVRCGG